MDLGNYSGVTPSEMPQCKVNRFEYYQRKDNIWVKDNFLNNNIVDIYIKDKKLIIPLREAVFKALKELYGDD